MTEASQMSGLQDPPEKAYVIDLSTLAKDEVRDTISGRDTGRAARVSLHVEPAAAAAETVEIRVPDHVRVVTPSFFVGLLSPEITATGDQVLARKKFVLRNASDTTTLNLAHAISTILRRGSPFEKLGKKAHRGLLGTVTGASA